MRNQAPLITMPLSDNAKTQIFSNPNGKTDGYLNAYVKEFLNENKIKRKFETKKSRILRMIAISILALILLIAIFYKAYYHKSILFLVIIAAIIYLIIHIKNASILSYLCNEVKKRPDDIIDNVLTSQISGCCRRLVANLYGAGIIAVVLTVCAFCFTQPRIVYEKNNIGGYSIRYYTLSLTEESHITLPETHNGLPVNEIRGETFCRMDFTSIDLPSGLTEIRGNTFQGCEYLTSIHIPESVTRIGGQAFSGCSRLASVNLPSGITEIHGNTFEYCSSLRAISIPYGVTRIGGHAFYGCSSLSSVDVPETVNEIGSSAFRLCSSLREIRIPEKTFVNEKAFKESPTKVIRY